MRRHQRAAVRVATAVAGSDRAADAAQEGFIRAYRALDRYDPGRPFRPWLLRIVANAARNELRTLDRHQRIRLRVARLTPVPDQYGDDPAVQADERQRLAAALTDLRTNDRLVLALRWFEDLTEAEMAEVLDVRPGTVKSRLSRAMTRLRATLAAQEGSTSNARLE